MAGTIISFALSMSAEAQTSKKPTITNPFGLVYAGAITKNVKGKVNIHPVSYKIGEIDIVANVYTPPTYDARKKYPAIVIAPDPDSLMAALECYHHSKLESEF